MSLKEKIKEQLLKLHDSFFKTTNSYLLKKQIALQIMQSHSLPILLNMGFKDVAIIQAYNEATDQNLLILRKTDGPVDTNISLEEINGIHLGDIVISFNNKRETLNNLIRALEHIRDRITLN